MAAGLAAALILWAALLGAAAAWRVGHPLAAHAVFAIILGYSLGQWIPL
jgi:hypothetical protein